MSTKLYDHAMDFLPAAKSGRGLLGNVKLMLGAFQDARIAAARYDALVARGVPAGRAARMAFEGVYDRA